VQALEPTYSPPKAGIAFGGRPGVGPRANVPETCDSPTLSHGGRPAEVQPEPSSSNRFAG